MIEPSRSSGVSTRGMDHAAMKAFIVVDEYIDTHSCSGASPTIVDTDTSDATSTKKALALPPDSRISFDTASALSRFRSAAIEVAPICEWAFAWAFPKPRPAPVTRAICWEGQSRAEPLA